MEKVGKVWSNLRKGCHTLFHPEGVAHGESSLEVDALHSPVDPKPNLQADSPFPGPPELPLVAEKLRSTVRRGHNCVLDIPQVVEMAVDREGEDAHGTGGAPLVRRDSYSRHAPWGNKKKHTCSAQAQSQLETDRRRGRSRRERRYGFGSVESEGSVRGRSPSPNSRSLGRRLQDTVGLCLPLRSRSHPSKTPLTPRRKIHLTELVLETCPFPPGSDLARKWHLIKRHTAPVSPPSSASLRDAGDPAHSSPEDEEERLRERRRLSIEEGVDPPPDAQIHSAPGLAPLGSLYKLGPKMAELGVGVGPGPGPGPGEGGGGAVACDSDEDSTTLCLQGRRPKQRHASGDGPLARQGPWKVHTQIDYIHCLVPDLLQITGLSCYWGVMDRYEAEALLEGKPEGTFLLRDSAQEDYLFSVSFRRYGRSLHARIEQWNHNFSFDAHDPCVFHAPTVTGLLEHYKDPSSCMFFEPLLTVPLHRTFPFSLQRLARAAVCRRASYDAIGGLPLPPALRDFLREYHYKQKVRVRWLERGPLRVK